MHKLLYKMAVYTVYLNFYTKRYIIYISHRQPDKQKSTLRCLTIICNSVTIKPKGNRLKRLARFVKLCYNNRHLPEWRLLRFILIVTVYLNICKVMIIGIHDTSSRRMSNRLILDQPLDRHYYTEHIIFCQPYAKFNLIIK